VLCKRCQQGTPPQHVGHVGLCACGGILDEQVATELKGAFRADLKRSSELQLERWRRRPLMERGSSWLAYQLHSQL
jgi:hypothetical protein